MSGGGFVAVMVIDLHFPDAGSLKGKRKELSSIKAQLRTRLGAAVAETDHQDLWQRATLTAVADRRLAARAVSAAADELERFVLSRCPDGASVERLVASSRTSADEVAARTSVRGIGCEAAGCAASTRPCEPCSPTRLPLI